MRKGSAATIISHPGGGGGGGLGKVGDFCIHKAMLTYD